MPLSKEDVKPKKAEPPAEEAVEEDPRMGDPHPGDLTPGMYAEQEVGLWEGDPTTEEAREHAAKFEAAKAKQRFGH